MIPTPIHPVAFIQYGAGVFVATLPTEMEVSRDIAESSFEQVLVRAEVIREDYTLKCACGWESPIKRTCNGVNLTRTHFHEPERTVNLVAKTRTLLPPCEHFHLIAHGALA